MKTTLHFPTEQYGYVEIEAEVDSVEEALQAYQEAQNSLKACATLNTKDWCRFLDSYVLEGKPPADGMALWEQMDARQKWMINDLKKTIKRANK